MGLKSVSINLTPSKCKTFAGLFTFSSSMVHSKPQEVLSSYCLGDLGNEWYTGGEVTHMYLLIFNMWTIIFFFPFTFSVVDAKQWNQRDSQKGYK